MNTFSAGAKAWKPAVVLVLVAISWFLDPSGPGVLWPTVVAIGATLVVRRTLIGLLLGALSGSVMIEEGSLWKGFTELIEKHSIPALQSGWNLSVLIFTLALGGLVALIEFGGGFQALLEKLLRFRSGSEASPSGKRLQWSAMAMGCVCFFDGLANSLLVGRTLKPFAARSGVSKEKLAYIVDSTSAAVACLAFVSTWIAYQLAMIREGFEQAGVAAPNPYPLFLKSIPWNFYCWVTLALLGVVIWRGWNFGPMRKCEDQAGSELMNSEPGTGSEIGNARHIPQKNQRNNSPSIWKGAAPILFLFGGLLVGLYVSGSQTLDPAELSEMSGLERISTAFGAADAARVFVLTTLLSCALALILNWNPGKNHPELSFDSANPHPEAPDVFLEGMKSLFGPALILIGAWSLGSTLKELEAGPFLASWLQGRLPDFALPVSVFILGALISFTTGTSWGTMGTLMPLALPVALGRLEGMDPELMASAPLVLAVVGAVFSGAVFGDHCSPLSDTTIVSAIACDVEPLDHVRTQLPYAMLAAAISAMLFLVFAFMS